MYGLIITSMSSNLSSGENNVRITVQYELPCDEDIDLETLRKIFENEPPSEALTLVGGNTLSWKNDRISIDLSENE